MFGLNWEEIVSMMAGAFFRKILTAAAVFFGTYGFTVAQQDSFINNGLAILISVAALALSFAWSFISGRNKLLTNPSTVGKK